MKAKKKMKRKSMKKIIYIKIILFFFRHPITLASPSKAHISSAKRLRLWKME